MRVLKGFSNKKKLGKHLYLRFLLWFLGRSLEKAFGLDNVIQQEFFCLPENFTFELTIYPEGPTMTVGKTTGGKVRFFRKGRLEKPSDVIISIHDIEAAMLLLTFRESTAVAAARDRISIYGSIVYGCTVVRLLDRIEMLLLPKFLAVRAVKRYESPNKKLRKRFRLYLGVLFLPGERSSTCTHQE